jgi:hypothetical protein
MGNAKDFGPFMNHPGSTGGVLIQTVSEFFGSFLKLKRKKGSGEKSESMALTRPTNRRRIDRR